MIEHLGSDGRNHVVDVSIQKKEAGRGLFSFLTWPFFLAQAWATLELISEFKATAAAAEAGEGAHAKVSAEMSNAAASQGVAHARPEQSVDDAAPVNSSNIFDAPPANNPGQPEASEESESHVASDKEDSPLESGGGSAVVADGETGPGAKALMAGGGRDVDLPTDHPADPLGGLSNNIAKVIGSSTPDPGFLVPTLSVHPVIDFLADIIGIPSPDVLDLNPLAAVAQNVFGLGSDLLVDASAILQQAESLVPLSAVTTVITDAASTAGDAVKGVDELLGGTGSIIHTIGHADVAAGVSGITSIASHILGEAQGTVTDVTTFQLLDLGHNLGGLFPSLQDAATQDQSIPSGLTSASAPVQVLGSLLEGAWNTDHGAVASDGYLAFPPAASVDSVVSDLFANGQHTNYGVAIHSENSNPASSVEHATDAKTDIVAVAEHTAEPGDNQTQPTHDHISHLAQPVAGEAMGSLDHVGVHLQHGLI